MQEKLELTRKLIDSVISTGRSFQSSQTGFIHYCYSHHADLIHHTIPIYKNALFALALFRSRLIENIREAQSLIGHLLAFQTEKGNFPLYLHEYPTANSFSLAIQMMAPFYWILKSFGRVLGQELRVALESSIKKLVSYLLEATNLKTFNYSSTVRLGAGVLAFGTQFNNLEWQEKGKALLTSLPMDKFSDEWLNTSHIGDILVALSLVRGEIEGFNCTPFIQSIAQTWHKNLATYCGPCISEHQNQLHPVVNLYEIYMAYLTGQSEMRFDQSSIEILEGALVHPISHFFQEDQLQAQEITGFYKESTWTCFKSQNSALTLLEKHPSLEEKLGKTYTPFRLIWGNASHPHSLICQGGNANRIDYQKNGSSIELIFDLNPSPQDPELAREICFYIDIHPEIVMTIGQLRTMVFELNQPIQVQLKEGMSLTLVFELLEGEGNFLGHIAQSNRPSQLKQIEARRFHVYDWVIFLRTLRRSDPCKIKVTVDVNSLD